MSSTGGRRWPALAMPNCRIPGDIIVNILSRLPVKSLLRFRSVSKPWLNLISNPNFISTQFNRTIVNSDDASLIVHTISNGHDHGITLVRVNSNEIPSIVPPIDFPFPSVCRNVVGTCNGIVCLSHSNCHDHDFEFVLWNPATRMWKGIPSPPRDPENVWVGVAVGVGDGIGIVSLGLGYDRVAFDFKVVRFELNSIIIGVEMYSAKAECWRYIGIDFQFISWNYGCNAVVQGNLYWVFDVKEVGDEHSQFREMLVKFDVVNEVFRKYPMMDLTSYNFKTRGKFVDLKDSLALMVYPPGNHLNKMVDVYVLDEDSSSWSKNFSIGPILETISWIEQYLSNGKIMAMIHSGNFILYYPETDEVETLHIDDIIEAVSFTESLAFIEGMEQVGKEDKHVKFGSRNWRDFLLKGFELCCNG